MTSNPKRRWQFGLRDLAWLTLVVAIALGWHRQWKRAEIIEDNVTLFLELKEASDVELVDDLRYFKKRNNELREENERLKMIADSP